MALVFLLRLFLNQPLILMGIIIFAFPVKKGKMLEKIQALQQEIDAARASTLEDVEALRIKYISKKGSINQLFSDFKNVPDEQKKEVGKAINDLKNFAVTKINGLRESFHQSHNGASGLDLTMPGDSVKSGTRHPLSLVKNKMVNIFDRLGFSVAEGPEIEDDWHVFSALNFPSEHPARDMQDTFFIEKDPDVLLRTHTSSVQIRVMEQRQPPIRAIFPGRVFRNEAISARSHCLFHQVEGLYVDENVSFADLKQTLLYFAQELFGEKTRIRLRPSYFPFTEPSAEMDVSCTICGGKGCNVCKYTGWLEILGCGMVDPNVLEACDIDSRKYTGFAFGMGIERIAMLRYGIKDIRHFFENDINFLRQFESAL
jgi:phenylalanyl-tRNA synthetase alpha chain